MASSTPSFKKKTSNPKHSKTTNLPGTKPSIYNNQLVISSGVASIDFILGGGLPQHRHAPKSSLSQADLHSLNLESSAQLRGYQITGVNWMIDCYLNYSGCILGDEMGLGKTIQSICVMLYLINKLESKYSFLVCCPLSLVKNWKDEIKKFAPSLIVLTLVGTQEERNDVIANLSDTHISAALITTPEYILKESVLHKIKWSAAIFDEAHILKNNKNKLYTTICSSFNIGFTLLLTGTPIQNNLNELYSLLSLISPQNFSIDDLDDFVNQFKDIINSKQDAENLHALLKPFILRRTKEEVLSSHPTCSEFHLYAPLSILQKKLYKAVLFKDITAFGESAQKTRLMNVLMQLRKCVNHPYIFDGVEPEPFEIGEHLVSASGKLVVLDQLLTHLHSNQHKVLLFSQMTRVLDIIQDYLAYRNYTYERLDGSVRGEERYLAINNFNQNDDTFIFLLSAKAGGVGLNLTAADTVIFYDTDFNPQNDLQAAARVHRIGQSKPVKIIRLITKHSVEEIILKRASSKLQLTEMIIEGGQFAAGATDITKDTSSLSEVLKFGLDQLLLDENSTGTDTALDFDTLIGSTKDGIWIDRPDTLKVETLSDSQDAITDMYQFEGEDYKKAAKDESAFDSMLQQNLSLETADYSSGSATGITSLGNLPLRNPEERTPAKPMLELVFHKKRVLTPEQLEAKRKKREENKINRQKYIEEQESLRSKTLEKKRAELWSKNNYTSTTISLSNLSDEDSDSSSDEVEDTSIYEMGASSDENSTVTGIEYVKGDVTQPPSRYTGVNDVIIVHCVNDSGKWGRGGVFKALSNRSFQVSKSYELAGTMKDLEMGSVHLISIDDIQSRPKGNDFAALIVCQTRSGHSVSSIDLLALEEGLRKIQSAAKKLKASVHLPRIGHSTPKFNWYGTERLIKKYLASVGIHTFVYYYSPKLKLQQ